VIFSFDSLERGSGVGKSEAEPEVAQAALAELCQYIGRRFTVSCAAADYTVHDAQDLTQAFRLPDRTQNIRSRRSAEGQVPFVFACFPEKFLAHAFDRERTLKRGGGQHFLSSA